MEGIVSLLASSDNSETNSSNTPPRLSHEDERVDKGVVSPNDYQRSDHSLGSELLEMLLNSPIPHEQNVAPATAQNSENPAQLADGNENQPWSNLAIDTVDGASTVRSRNGLAADTGSQQVYPPEGLHLPYGQLTGPNDEAVLARDPSRGDLELADKHFLQVHGNDVDRTEPTRTLITVDSEGQGRPSWKRPPRILLAEADPTYFYSKWLESSECILDVVTDGLGAILKVQEGSKYDVILIDDIMPNLDGISASQIIRQVDRTPIIVMTSRTRADDFALCSSSDINEVLVEPFTSSALFRTLARHLTYLNMTHQPERRASDVNSDQAIMESSIPRSESAFLHTAAGVDHGSTAATTAALTPSLGSVRQRYASILDAPAAPPESASGKLKRSEWNRPDLQCRNCGYSAKTRSDLKKHSARHVRQHKCPFLPCSQQERGFATFNDLDRHMRAVHKINTRNSKTYKCFDVDCTKADKEWPRLDNFKLHIQKTHGSENLELLLRL
jgi:CheY-like chemotaxis protein